jgi:hypothetical protein
VVFLNIFGTVLVPVLLLAAVGFLITRRGLIEDSRSVSRVALYVLLPALTFSAVAKSDLRADESFVLVVFAWAMAGLQGLLGFSLARCLSLNPLDSGALLLSVMTVNAGNYGIAVNQFAFGPPAVSRATLYYVATLLVTYVGAVLVVTPSVHGLRVSARKVLTMPLIYAAAAGLAVNQTGLVVPEPILRPIQLAGSAAVPTMLLLLGTELARARVQHDALTLSVACTLRLIVAPFLAFAAARVLGVEGLTRDVAVVQSSMPTAVGAALVAVELNSRPSLVSSSVLVTTLASVVTLTILLGLLH